jgi:hypothetical protein
MQKLRKLLLRKQIRLSAVFMLLLWVVERLAAVHGSLSFFGMEKEIPAQVVGFAKSLLDSPLFLMIIGAMILGPLLVALLERNHAQNISKLEHLFEKLIDAIRIAEKSSAEHRQAALEPYLEAIRRALPGPSEDYRITVVRPKADGKYTFQASLNVDQTRIFFLAQRLDWKSGDGLYLDGLNSYKVRKPSDGRDAIIRDDNSDSYVSEVPTEKYHRGAIHLVITIEPRRHYRVGHASVKEEELAVIAVSCKDGNRFSRGNELNILELLKHEISCIETTLYQYELVPKLQAKVD